MLYNLESPLFATGDLVHLHDTKSRLAEFFIWNEGNAKFLQFVKPRAVAQERLTLSTLLTADYLRADIGIPIFSPLARTALEKHARGQIEFFECVVVCDGEDCQFFLGKVINYLPLVDRKLSEFRTLALGERILSKAVFRQDVEHGFLIARDAEFCERLVVTDRFASLCRSENLNIRCEQPV
jgi:hypothetical protein